MINDFYLTSNDKLNVDISNNPISVYNPEMLANVVKDKTDVISVIEAIEKYNNDNKLNVSNKIMYAIYVGDHFVVVHKGYFTSDKSTFICLSPDGTGAVNYKYGNGRDALKLKDMSPTLSTHYIPVSMIVDVIIRSYDKSKFDVLDNDDILYADKYLESELISKLKNLFSKTNAFVSAGMYRSAIDNINIEFKSHNLNDKNIYYHKREAYNNYVTLFSRYLDIIGSVVRNYEASTKLGEVKSHNGMYFVDYKIDPKDDEVTKNNKVKTVINSLINTLKDNNIKDSYETMHERIFDISDIKIFKEILK